MGSEKVSNRYAVSGGGWNIFKRLPYGMAPSKFRPAVESLYGGQSTSSTQLIIPDHLVVLPYDVAPQFLSKLISLNTAISVLEPGMIQPKKTRMQNVRLDNNTNIYCIKMK